MEYNNKLIELAKKTGGIDKETLKTFTVLLAPFAPHIGEENLAAAWRNRQRIPYPVAGVR